MPKMNILLCGGGTGGHYYPLMAIKNELNLSISKEKETSSQQDGASAEQNKNTYNVSNSPETENNNQKSSDK